MSDLTTTDIEKLAQLAQLKIDAEQIPVYLSSLSNIMNMISEMEKIDTSAVAPLAHPLNASQRLRNDEITEPDQRSVFQSLTPDVVAGLYLVPKVID